MIKNLIVLGSRELHERVPERIDGNDLFFVNALIWESESI